MNDGEDERAVMRRAGVLTRTRSYELLGGISKRAAADRGSANRLLPRNGGTPEGHALVVAHLKDTPFESIVKAGALGRVGAMAMHGSIFTLLALLHWPHRGSVSYLGNVATMPTRRPGLVLCPRWRDRGSISTVCPHGDTMSTPTFLRDSASACPIAMRRLESSFASCHAARGSSSRWAS
jgi:hypothetical protein